MPTHRKLPSGLDFATDHTGNPLSAEEKARLANIVADPYAKTKDKQAAHIRLNQDAVGGMLRSKTLQR